MKLQFMLSVITLMTCILFQANGDIIGSKGWLETFYVTWTGDATAYNVYYRANGASSWAKIDGELIRDYKNYFRADVLGIKAGTYEARVVPVNNGVEGVEMTASNIQVTAHDRSGFAFLDGVVPGAYKADGTLKDDAQVIYITNGNKDNVTFAVKTNANGATTSGAGLQAIMKNVEKGYENRPLAFRFIGRMTDQGFTLTDGGGDVNIKDNCKNTTGYITFEGVGDDATAYGWAFKTARAKNLEIRNLGFMLTNSTEGDNVGINTNSEHIWIHNNDMFYGNAGSDADQVKGDGATDVKASTNVTISYNHYWDSGKTHLLGNSASETPGSITVHHNWYDHSDSRHPRVRKHYVHVYNNYYDGVATYGIGAVMASSVFAEKNYFRNTNRPMMTAGQGTDASAGGSGTFSGEDGGTIKAFSNFMDNSSKSKYIPYSNSAAVEFDAYEVSSATTTVPSNVTAKKGGATFNNDMIPAEYEYITDDDSAAVRVKVTTYAGRYWGGDFKFAFTSIDDGTTAVNTALKTALQNYRGGLETGGTPPTGTIRQMSASRQKTGGNYLIVGRNIVRLQIIDDISTTVKIFDLKGGVIRVMKFRRGRHAILLGNLPRGTYIVRAKSDVWQKMVRVNAVK